MEIITTKLNNAIAVTLRTAAAHVPSPIIILCHGFCGIQPILLPAFVSAFTAAGFHTITFNYRGFGDSDGERSRLVPAMQIDGILAVIAWAKQQTGLTGRASVFGEHRLAGAMSLARRRIIQISNILSVS